MRKVFLLIAACLVLASLTAQIEEQPPKIIMEIDKQVREIDSLTLINKPIIDYDSSSTFHWEKTFIWIIDNHIQKISFVGRFQHGDVQYHEFYYSQNQVILSKSGELKKFQPSTNFTGKPIQKDTLTEIFYYDYNETVSKPELFILGKDTFFIDVDMLKIGYDFFNQYKHLQNYNPFSSLTYNKVVAYEFDGEGGRQIVEKGKLVRDAKNPKTLTAEQIKHFTNTITDTTTYGYGNAMCFDPRMGIVFYQDKKIVGYISICFECNSLFSSVYLPATVHYMGVNEGDDYYVQYPQHGLSPQGRKQLRKLCSELGLQKCPLEDSHWDVE